MWADTSQFVAAKESDRREPGSITGLAAMGQDPIEARPETGMLGLARWTDKDRERHLFVAIWTTEEDTIVPGIGKGEGSQ